MPRYTEAKQHALEEPEGSSGTFDFMEPRGNLGVTSRLDSDLFLQGWQVCPPPSSPLIFPSYLMHWVRPVSHGDRDRISIAFHIRYDVRPQTRSRGGSL